MWGFLFLYWTLPSTAIILLVSRLLTVHLDADNLFEINRYLDRNIKFRLAFREFGTCMGISCQSEQTTEKDRAVDLKVYADAIITAWDPYMELSISEVLTPEDLRPITRVMYASALIPGGDFVPVFFSAELARCLLIGIFQLSVRDTWALNRMLPRLSEQNYADVGNWMSKIELYHVLAVRKPCLCSKTETMQCIMNIRRDIFPSPENDRPSTCNRHFIVQELRPPVSTMKSFSEECRWHIARPVR